MEQKPAIVLLSGGLDSATCAAMAVDEGYRVTALSFAYGQRHAVEIDRARAVARALGVAEHHVIELDLAAVGGSVLTGPGEIPRDREDPLAGGVPPTYVPARNTVFLAHALAWAEARDIGEIFVGVNHLDSSGYPDCRPAFIAAFQEVARQGTKAGAEGRTPRIRAPLIDMTKAQIIRRAHELGVDLSLTVSCYDADAEGRACGRCDSCVLRRRGFREAGIPDPTRYR
jgi:7-cyano-7-deazaguanine synthase